MSAGEWHWWPIVCKCRHVMAYKGDEPRALFNHSEACCVCNPSAWEHTKRGRIEKHKQVCVRHLGA